MKLVLTAADHDANGFVALARWPESPESEARRVLAGIDASITDEMEPDDKTVPFSFILDMMDGDHTCVDTTTRSLPLQVAMRLAYDPVLAWLEERPQPDVAAYRLVPLMPLSTLA
jgi:hypothetical protein